MFHSLSSLYILDINPLSDMSFANIFSHSVGCFFVLLMVPFAVLKLQVNTWCWENWTATYKRMKQEHFLTPYTKLNSKCTKDLNIRTETIKLIEDNIGSTLFDIGLTDFFFLVLPPQARETKAKINKWDLITLLCF